MHWTHGSPSRTLSLKENPMPTTRVSTPNVPWTSAAEFYGDKATHDGAPVYEIKVLSDTRAGGGGIAYLLKTTPPKDRLVKIIATARSDEHVFVLEGGGCNKSGERLAFPGDYRLNPAGQAHSAFIGMPSVSLIVYAGEPDEIHSIDFVEIER
jgi:hypothetical protein